MNHIPWHDCHFPVTQARHTHTDKKMKGVVIMSAQLEENVSDSAPVRFKISGRCS